MTLSIKTKLKVKPQEYGVSLVHYERPIMIKNETEILDANVAIDYVPQRDLLIIKDLSDWLGRKTAVPTTIEQLLQDIHSMLLDTLGDVRFTIVCSVSIYPAAVNYVSSNRLDL